MSSGNREIVFSVELKFLRNDSEWFLGNLTLYSPVQYIIWDIGYVMWKLTSWNHFLNFWKRCFIVTPVESLFYCFFFREWKILLCYSLIVSKRTHARRKKFSPLSVLLHLLYDLGNQFFILLFAVLFVENTVLFIAESDA